MLLCALNFLNLKFLVLHMHCANVCDIYARLVFLQKKNYSMICEILYVEVGLFTIMFFCIHTNI